MNEELLEQFKDILKEKNIDINSILNGSSENEEANKNTNDQSSYSQNNFDLDTLLKIKNIFDKLNTNSSKNVNLLLALKPFLRKSRKDKLDEYIQMLKVAEIAKELGIFGGDSS